MGTVEQLRDQLTTCDDCGAAVYAAPVRLTGGSRRYLAVDMVPWTPGSLSLRLSRSERDGWYVDPYAGAWAEHACQER